MTPRCWSPRTRARSWTPGWRRGSTLIPPSLTSGPSFRPVLVELAKPMLNALSGSAKSLVNMDSQASFVICDWGRLSPSTELWASTMERVNPSFDATSEASVMVFGSRSSERKGELERIDRIPFPNAMEVMLVIPILSYTGPLIMRSGSVEGARRSLKSRRHMTQPGCLPACSSHARPSREARPDLPPRRRGRGEISSERL